MARPRKETKFTREEVEYVAQMVLAKTLSQAGHMLLNAGAQPSPEIGAIIMHLINGANISGKEADEFGIKYQMDSIESPEKVEIFTALQEIISGQTK